ncbi:NAD(P)-dependent dehydrogenase (short-subunit alcohol dehydrogenase family) [Nocardioides daedukensis]|uniref:NAD(P)-dependent dehydrogenase (Short-subunit alcohol dehydrogenase family) n=1 Tax=Nocardioides daedukensis TaxID=634462 RepID=A0A7Y9UPB7_9ACTN|nr:SDR family oxidoreductase [Nocardioides daedukensis]NYG59443.1 NAD(P)-dependent dehydrogenase (short-subunit alcohol dehydrogenase family) [Nocardioides daedukensis]
MTTAQQLGITARAALPALLPDKVVMVCGVGPDLGRSLALRSAQAGADVVLAARDGERLAEVEKEVQALGRRALSVPTDVTDAAARRALADQALSAFGRVDALINAAFIHPPSAKLLDADLDEMRRMTDVNVLASVGLVQELAPSLIANNGAVVLINSIVLRNRLPGFGPYRMDKAALLAAARSLSVELGPQGVRVNSVAPGYIWGQKLRGSFERREARGGKSVEESYAEIARQTDSNRLPTPDEIADAAVFLASDFASGITGQCLDVTCGQSHH